MHEFEVLPQGFSTDPYRYVRPSPCFLDEDSTTDRSSIDLIR